MKNLAWELDVDINEFFPQSYDLTDLQSQEFRDFLNKMKFGQMVACLKSALNMSEKSLHKNLQRINISIGFIKRRIKLMGDDIFDPN